MTTLHLQAQEAIRRDQPSPASFDARPQPRRRAGERASLSSSSTRPLSDLP